MDKGFLLFAALVLITLISGTILVSRWYRGGIKTSVSGSNIPATSALNPQASSQSLVPSAQPQPAPTPTSAPTPIPVSTPTPLTIPQTRPSINGGFGGDD